jgi:RNA polymerase sigma factor (sigma-70 family)
MHTATSPRRSSSAATDSRINPVLRAGLKRYPPLAADDQHATAVAAWLAREEAWSLILADSTARSRAVAVAEAEVMNRPDDRGPAGKRAAECRRALLDALSTGDPRTIARADKDDTILRLAVAAIDSRLCARVHSCMVRLDAAIARLERHNLALVLFAAGRYGMTTLAPGDSRIEFDDLIAWGMPGLRIAAIRFDPARGVKFSTFAVNWIRETIIRSLANLRHRIRLPVHLQESAAKIHRAEAVLHSSGRTITDEAVAEVSGLTIAKVRAVREGIAVNGTLSLNQTPPEADRYGGRRIEVGDTIVDHDAMTEADYVDADEYQRDLAAVTRALESLSPADRFVLECRAGCSHPDGEGETHQAIGDALGLCREAARKRERAALTRARRFVAAERREAEVRC